MKTLGAGFHQPIQGVHCLSLEEQQKLSAHNAGLSTYAAMHGIQVVDTFNMTVARFKDFYPGKCACHFHLITDIESKSMSTSQQRYHVEGFVNAAYSEIFISRLCSER
ncbi:cadherin-like and PC-esterase domain-containing protein 1, partial [Leptotrombidium deliense]